MNSMTDRRPIWLGSKDLTILVVYIFIVSFAVHFYQAWQDEGVAWMVSKSSQIYPLLFHKLRYQGHPCLWYLLLWIPAHLDMPFIYINWLSATIASLGIYVLLRFSPFPFYLRALLPFGFYLQYEYAVVARSYVLFPLLGLIAAALYRRNYPNMIVMAVVLALLANVSIHGTLVAIGFALLCGWGIAKERSNGGITAQRKHQAFIAAGIFLSSVAFVAICVWPSHDVQIEFHPEILKPFQCSAHEKMSFSAHLCLAPPSSVTTAPSASTLRDLPTDAGSPNRLVNRVRFIVGYSLAKSILLALLYDSILLLYLYRGGKIWLILPVALLGLFLLLFKVELWHVGLIWVTLIMVLWAAWDSSPAAKTWNLQNIVAGLLAVLCILQLPWTWGAVRYEMGHSTYPAKEAAAYLKTLPRGKRMDQLGIGYTVLPYFTENIFIDHGGDPFGHREKVDDTVRTVEVLDGHPDLILVDARVFYRDIVAFQEAGYYETHSFCGARYFPNRQLSTFCLIVVEKPATL